MKKAKLLLLFLLFSSFFNSSCKKGDDAEKQLQKDERLIKEYITANNIPAIRHDSGVYYQIIEPGTGNVAYTSSTSVRVKYTLRLLGGQVIPQTTEKVDFTLGRVITGWQIGIPLIQQGGRIRLFVPSIYAYGPYSQNGIPANSVLDFDIELFEVGVN